MKGLPWPAYSTVGLRPALGAVGVPPMLRIRLTRAFMSSVSSDCRFCICSR